MLTVIIVFVDLPLRAVSVRIVIDFVVGIYNRMVILGFLLGSEIPRHLFHGQRSPISQNDVPIEDSIHDGSVHMWTRVIWRKLYIKLYYYNFQPLTEPSYKNSSGRTAFSRVAPSTSNWWSSEKMDSELTGNNRRLKILKYAIHMGSFLQSYRFWDRNRSSKGVASPSGALRFLRSRMGR